MKIYIILLSILLTSCGVSNDSSNEQSSKQSILLETSRIIFYHPTEHEFDSLALLPNSDGLNEVDADFSYYTSNAIDSLNNAKIKVELTTDRFINIGKQKIDKFEHFGYGLILVRADSINIQPGVMTDQEYIMLITEFYGL